MWRLDRGQQRSADCISPEALCRCVYTRGARPAHATRCVTGRWGSGGRSNQGFFSLRYAVLIYSVVGSCCSPWAGGDQCDRGHTFRMEQTVGFIFKLDYPAHSGWMHQQRVSDGDCGPLARHCAAYDTGDRGPCVRQDRHTACMHMTSSVALPLHFAEHGRFVVVICCYLCDIGVERGRVS